VCLARATHASHRTCGYMTTAALSRGQRLNVCTSHTIEALASVVAELGVVDSDVTVNVRL